VRVELDSAGIGLTTICPGVKARQVEARRAQIEKAFAARGKVL
jgi:hypothetical protein